MKTQIFFIFFLLFIQETKCQTYKHIELKQPPYPGKEKFGFKNFKVIDARQDSGKVGYMGYYNKEPHKLISKNSLAPDVNSFLADYYENSFSDSNYSVLIVIKKLWISQYDSTLIIGNDQLSSGKIIIEKLKLEFYLNQGNDYYPVLRIDTSFFTTQKNSVKAFGNEIADGITSCCNKLFSININGILQRKKLTFNQIEEYNNKLFDKPILRTANFRKGVYLTFEEFLNNEPSVVYKNIDQKKFGDVLYLQDEKGNDYPSNKFWGYSDGKDVYITSGKNFFKLYRVQSTFEFFGIKNLRERFNYGSSRNSSGEGPEILHKRKPELNMFFYQVDMETGEIY